MFGEGRGVVSLGGQKKKVPYITALTGGIDVDDDVRLVTDEGEGHGSVG